MKVGKIDINLQFHYGNIRENELTPFQGHQEKKTSANRYSVVPAADFISFMKIFNPHLKSRGHLDSFIQIWLVS